MAGKNKVTFDVRIDEELCAVFVLGNIGGYPVGARLLDGLVRQGRLSAYHASRLLCCCYGSGPSFIISIAGMRVFGSAQAGMVLFAACFLSSIVVGIFVCRFGERIELQQTQLNYDLSAACFVSSVMSAARVMYTVCAMIVGFSAVTALLDITGVTGMAERLFGSAAVFQALMEISRVQIMAAHGEYAFGLCGALLSFGGVCVVMQVVALTSGRVPLKGFLLSRIPAAVLSAVTAEFLRRLFGVQAEVHSQAVFAHQTASQMFSVNAGMSACVLIMCGMLLGMEKRRKM